MRRFYLVFIFILIALVGQAQQQPFVTTWEVESYLTIVIPTVESGYNYTVDFGDGTIVNNITGDAAHTYSTSGTYTVSISGDFPRIYFHRSNFSARIQTIEQWGDIAWTSMERAFADCSNLIINATDAPDLSQVTSLKEMFKDCWYLNGNINDWDVSNISTMESMFQDATRFNGSLNNWDVSNVTDMSNMFKEAHYFNRPIGSWNVSNVQNMGGMFYRAIAFNQPLENWDVSNVANMSEMFYNSPDLGSSRAVFNQPLGNWNVSNVTNMSRMFMGSAFNKSLEAWDVSNVTNMSSMFYKSSFIQPLESWDVSNVNDMSEMFRETNFNQPLEMWDVSNVTDMTKMFYSAKAFNQPLNNWNVSNVTYMADLFNRTVSFNQPLDIWDVSNVVHMAGMFDGAVVFNQPLQNWDVSGVLNMSGIFRTASSFNQPLDTWDVSNVNYMDDMFAGAKKFNQNLTAWTFNQNVYLSGFLRGCEMFSVSNYDSLLLRFIDLNLQNKNFGIVDLYYCNQDARDTLVNEQGWSFTLDNYLNNCDSFPSEAFITRWKVPNNYTLNIPTVGQGYNYTIDFGDGTIESGVTGNISHTYSNAGAYRVNISGDFPRIQFRNQNLIAVEQWGDIEWQTMEEAFLNCTKMIMLATDAPDLSQVTNMSGMFNNCGDFNQSINHWDVSNVLDMSYMFAINVSAANAYNQPLDNWDVSNVTNMKNMFAHARSFNQPLNTWDVSNVSDMRSMFYHASIFNQPLDNWDVSSVVNMSTMFYEAEKFDQSLNNWDVSNVTDMTHMFMAAQKFNQPLNNWDVSNVLNMGGMFYRATDFNQDLSEWSFNDDIVLIDNNDGFIEYSALDILNYDALLARFVNLDLQGKRLYSSGITYCNELVRNQLIDEMEWNIFNDALADNCSYNLISGNVRYDEDNDGCDENDLIYNGTFSVNISGGNLNIGLVPNREGDYSFYVEEGTYEVGIMNLNDYFAATPSTVTINFEEFVGEEEIDFCITAIQTIEDLNVTLLPIQSARPGFQAVYQLVVENTGTHTINNAMVSLEFDDTKQSFLEADQDPFSETAISISFEIDEIRPFQSRFIDLKMQTFAPPIVNGEDILELIAHVSPDENDYTPDDNTFVLEQVVVNSFDPNDIQVLQGEGIYMEQADEYLDYLIRFQNTGNGDAINVHIVDSLDHRLDWSTFRPISASHEYRVEIINGNIVDFIFDDINLPYEAADEQGSHGFVAYKIKPKDDARIGDVFSAKADIFFDFNEAIITNTVTTEIMEPLGIEEHPNLEDKVKAYPNPVENTLYLYLDPSLNLEEISIYNLQGGKLGSFLEKSFDAQNLASGMYFLRIKTDHGTVNRRFIKR
jgi:surface protein